MDFELTDDLAALQDVAGRFAADHIAPNARQWDREADIPREIVAKLGELGFLGIFVPTEYGGCGFGDQEAAVVGGTAGRPPSCWMPTTPSVAPIF